VDATFLDTRVPATHERAFRVSDDVICIPPNDLPRLAAGHHDFVILGAGKTAMDTGVWLVENGADPNCITWVRPRESWIINRRTTQPGTEFFHDTVSNYASQVEAMAEAPSCDELFERLENCGYLLRIDPDRWPEMFHYATISEGEIESLRQIKRVIAGCHIAAIKNEEMEATTRERFSIPKGALYIDCTACAVTIHEPVPVFEDRRITLQMLRVPFVPFSAAFTAYLETLPIDDAQRNQLACPGPFPDKPEQFMQTQLHNMMFQHVWAQNEALAGWIENCRLEGFGSAVRNADESDPTVEAVLTRIKAATKPAVENLQRLIVETPGAEKRFVASR
jgi:hypothetical protein